MTTNKLNDYLALLNIRQAAGRRDTLIIGGLFTISFVAMIALTLLNEINGRALTLVVAIVVAFGFGYLTTWIKLEVVKGIIELIENLPD